MHAKGASPALSKYSEIAAGLCSFDDTEGVLLVGNGKIDGVVAGDLQEDAGIGSAFVGLASGMQKARTKSKNRRDLLLVPHAVANGLQNSIVLGIHGDVAEQSEIVSLANAREVSFQDLGKRLSLLEGVGVFCVSVELHTVAFEKRLFRRQLAGCFVFAGEFSGCHLTCFHVRLVEGVYPDDRTRYGCGNFPAEKFFADGIGILHGDAHYRVACFLEDRDGDVLRLVGCRFEAEIGEYAIRAVVVWPGYAFAVHRNDSFAAFSRGFGEQLLEPGSEIRNTGRRDDGQLVATVVRRSS